MASNNGPGLGGNLASASESDVPQIINPPAAWFDFTHTSRYGFHYSEQNFNHQFDLKLNGGEKYKQKEAFPRPDGITLDEWTKAFNSADTIVYKENSSSSKKSKEIRQTTHYTRDIAERKLLEKLTKLGRSVPGPGFEESAPGSDSSQQNSDPPTPNSHNQQQTSTGNNSNQNSQFQTNQSSTVNNSNGNGQFQAKRSSTENNSNRKGQSQAKQSNQSTEATQSNKRNTKMATQGKTVKTPKKYCTCKQTLHGIKMIACDGNCNNWFHLTCIDMAARDADIVASFICEDCVGCTTFKRLCRLQGCMKPHEVVDSLDQNGNIKRKVSKYCSEVHRDEFWEKVVSALDEFFAGQLRSAMGQIPLGGFRELGTIPVLNDPEFKTGPPYDEEGMFLFDIKIRDDCKRNITTAGKTVLNLTNRLKLIAMTKKYSDDTIKQFAQENGIPESSLKRKKSTNRFVCGYDPRLCVTDKWIARYMEHAEGALAWETGVIGEHTNPEFKVDIEPDYYKGICVKLGSKLGCSRHPDWYDTHYKDSFIMKGYHMDGLVKQTEKLQDMYDRVQLRLSINRAREEYVEFRLSQMSEQMAKEFRDGRLKLRGDPDWVVDELLKKAYPDGMDHLDDMYDYE